MKKEIFILITIIFIGTFLRFYKLTYHHLWLDEVLTVNHSAGNFKTIVLELKNWASPPLFYFLLNLWMKIFGKTEFVLRLLPAIFGITTIFLIYKVGKKMFNQNTGLIASLLLAISPFHIAYSQEVRMYTLLSLLCLVSVYLLYKALNENKIFLWLGYAVITELALYTHNWGIFFLIAQNIYIFLFQTKNIKKFVYAQFFIVLFYLPWVPVVFHQTGNRDIFLYLSRPSINDIKLTFEAFTGIGFGVGEGDVRLPQKWRDFALWMFAFLCIFGIVKEFKKYKKEIILLIFCFLTTLLLAFLVSLKIPLYKPDKYTIIVFPLFCILIASGISNFYKSFGLTIILTIAILSSMSLFQYYFLIHKSYSKEIAEYIKHNCKNNDIVSALPNFESIAVQYYYDGDIIEISQIKEKIKKKLFLISADSFWRAEIPAYQKELFYLRKTGKKDFGSKSVIIYQK